MEGELHLPFMIGINSCYLITGWNLGFYPYPDWSSSHSKFLTNHKMSTIWFRTAFVLRVFCSCPRGLSCAVGLRNEAVFPSSFPCLWEAREGLGGAVCFSATCFVLSMYFLIGRHPTPPCEMDDFTVKSYFHSILP